MYKYIEVVDSRIEAQLCFDFDMCCGRFVVVQASLTSDVRPRLSKSGSPEGAGGL